MFTHNLKLKLLLLISISLVYTLVAFTILRNYMFWDFNIGIALMLAPYICSIQRGKLSLRYLLPALIITLLALTIPVKTLLFLAILFGVMLFIENFFGKINNVVMFLMVLVSPIFKYFSNALGFPIRLWLSQTATNILSILGYNCKANGNIIKINNFDFSVDQACAGLNMLATSLIICLFFIAYYQKKQNKDLSFLQCAGLILITIALNIFSNLLRIILLIIFKIMPDNFFHHLIGVMCLLVYVVIPQAYLIKYFVNFFGKKAIENTKKTYTYKLRFPIIHMGFLLFILLIAYKIKNTKADYISFSNIIYTGFKQTILESGVTKIKTPQTLIYLKPTKFYAPEHNPMICWKGSGYDFKSIKKETIEGKEIYTSVLIKGKDKIYAAWWFESKKIQTINQLLWRWEAFKTDDHFYLINVNASNYPTLLIVTKKIIARDYSL